MKKVCAVVVTFNRKELLKEVLTALNNIKYEEFKVLVIDNASTDGTYQYIEDILSERIIYKNTGSNLGGAGGFSFGISEAIKAASDYVWVMDDDCVPTENALDELLKFAGSVNDNFGYLSSKALWKDNTPCVMNIERTSLSREIKDFTKNQRIMLASFVSLFLNAKAVIDLGLPYKDFFIWGDDWEYTYRIANKYPCYFVADSIVMHKCNKNMGVSIVEDNNRVDRYFYAYRNEYFFYKKAGFKGRLYNFLKVSSHRIKLILSSAKNKKEKLDIIKKGIKAGKKYNPLIEYAYPDNKHIRICEFFCEPLSYGGQEAFMLNMYEEFNNPNNEYNLVSPFICDNKKLIEVAARRNEEIHAYKYPFDTKKRKAYIKEVAINELSRYHYDVIHIQSGSIYALLTVAKIAKQCKIKRIIVHSHCAGGSGLKYKLIKFISDHKMKKYANSYYACSELAAECKFDSNIIKNNYYTLINNGISTSNFRFNQEVREKYRNDFGLTNELVILNVGRFSLQKNHIFTINIAKGLIKKELSFKIILVGDGELKEEIKNKIHEEKLDDYFILLEKRSDVQNIMMASDVFILPSLYEGLSVTSIEAQASGLYTLCSNTITDETAVTNLIEFLPIVDSDIWVERILCIKPNSVNRGIYAEKIKASGYDRETTAKFLESDYRR